MGLAQKSVAYIEPQEYLLLESHASEKHEYLDGVIYAWQGSVLRGMAGAPIEHNHVSLNIASALRAQVAGGDCAVYMADVRVRPQGQTAYFYPDVMVRCGPPLPPKTLEIDDACVVVEVLSDTTEAFDRQDKFDRYRCMPSLAAYVLVSPARRSVEVFRRDHSWGPAEPAAPGRHALGVRALILDASTVFEGL